MKKHFLIAAIFFAATGIATHLAAQVTSTDVQKVKTKSNIKNDKIALAASTENTAIKLTTPANGKLFTVDELTKSITFRWTPLVPRPKEPVTYRLKVWQLMQGQNGTQAMRTNKPIIEKDVMDVTQVAVNGIYSGPCKPPYMCDFIWIVEAIAADGKPITEKGTQEASSFSIEKS